MQTTGPVQSCSASALVRNFGHWSEVAASTPVIIRHHGRPRLALVATHALPAATPPAPRIAELALDLVPERIFRVDRLMQADPLNHAARANPIALDAGSSLGITVRRALASSEGDMIEIGSTLAAIVPLGDAALVVLRDRGAILATEDAMQELAASSAAAEASGLIRFRLNARGYVVGRNLALARIVGLGEPVRPIRFVSLFAPGSRARIGEAIEQAFEARAAQALDATLNRADGTGIAVRLGLAPLRKGSAVVELAGIAAPVGVQPKA